MYIHTYMHVHVYVYIYILVYTHVYNYIYCIYYVYDGNILAHLSFHQFSFRKGPRQSLAEVEALRVRSDMLETDLKTCTSAILGECPGDPLTSVLNKGH